jgi:predicted nucleotidyltransferase
MTLLQRIESERREARERLRQETRNELLRLLGELQPAGRVIIFGSVTQAGRFGDTSDVDLALEAEPRGMSVYQFTSLLGERLGRRVDVVVLSESRLAEKIRREGEVWMLPG